MKHKLLLLVTILAYFNLLSQETNFNHIAAGNGLSQISVMSIFQDEHGYMWFGTREGLNRFDGKDIEVYLSDESDENGLQSNIINKICGNFDGKLYLLCGYQHLVEYDKRLDKFTSITDNCQTISQGKTCLWYVVNNQIFKLNFSNNKSTPYYKVDSQYSINKILELNSGKVYLGTNSGLTVLDDNKVFNTVIPSYNITSIYEDSKKNIWVGTSANGVLKINRTGLIDKFTDGKAVNNSLSSNIIRDFCEDNFGQIWVATFIGLDKIIPESGQIINHQNYGNKPTDLSHTSIYSLFKDKQGTLWIGTYYGGINYFNPEANIYTYFYPNSDNSKTINFPIVGKMTEDNNNDLWICTEGGGLNRYNRRDKSFTYYKANGINSISHNNLKCIWYNQNNDKLYIGTHMGGLSIYDIEKNKFTNITTNTSVKMPNNIIEAIQAYKNHLIILTQKGIVQLNFDTEKITDFFDDQELTNSIDGKTTTFTIDSKDNMWLAKTDGGIKRINLRTKEIKDYQYDSSTTGSIGKQSITRIYEDRRGRLFFASMGSGLFEYLPNKDIFLRYTTSANGLMSDFIYDIVETSYGYLFLLTNSGINIFDPETNKNQFLDYQRGLPLERINLGCGIYVTKNGEVFVGGINGMASFYENQITPILKDYNLFFSELYLNNEIVKPNDKTKTLDQAFVYQKSITLTNRQNNILIKFAVSNYVKANAQSYEYRLVGLDNKWIPTRNQTINYSNLSPGSYTLQIREVSNNHGYSKEIHLPIKVLPPFYASTLAYLIYILLIGFILWKIISFNKSKILLKTSLDYEIREKGRIEELNQTKLRFFTNISHEFRTPLTLIIGQIESMSQMENITPAIHNKLVNIYKNATHLRSLITELLDFRKQEKDLLAIKVSNQDIVAFVKNSYQSFIDMALDRTIDYKFISTEKSINLWFDPVQLQKVFYNLISNAFKYTDDNGKIAVRVERKSNKVKVSVIDAGIGLNEEDLDKIFDRFYEPKKEQSIRKKHFSTGVGLALSKGIIDLHHGTIKAIRNTDKGSTFSVELLLGSEHFSSEDKSVNNEMDLNNLIDTELPDKLFLESIVGEDENKDEKSRWTILIVEDNEEMLHFLIDIFSAIYHVESATDGSEALKKVKELQPDLVLSDVMMPNMSGTELCNTLKTNFETSHIPIVLLTADSSEEQNIEGLMVGADDYITKPFNVKALISRCNNLIINRKRIQEKFSLQIDEAPIALATSKMDQELLEKATEVVMRYIDDPDFDVTTFAREMALGRSNLYLKLKGITGMTPNNFILNIRLKTAANLLRSDLTLNISDITYKLGFSTPRYFSKCFKELFGLSPLYYRKANNPNSSEDEIISEDVEE